MQSNNLGEKRIVKKMKTRDIIRIILLGAIILYCSKILIQASTMATTDALNEFYSLLGWSMYVVGLFMFIGSICSYCVKLIKPWSDD